MEGLSWLMIYRHHGQEIMQQEQGIHSQEIEKGECCSSTPFSFHAAKIPTLESRFVNI